MISGRSEFNLVDRGYSRTLLLIPGWAADPRIFATLELKYNYLFPQQICAKSFTHSLSDALEKNKLKKISILGYSLGGFLALEFAKKHLDEVDELFLVSIRKSYSLQELQGVRERIIKNKAAFLNRFYGDWFNEEDEGQSWFKKNLLKEYISEMRLKDLLEGLDYLASVCVEPGDLSLVKPVVVFHGTKDKIAPFKEVETLVAGSLSARFVPLEQAGHMPFFNREFHEKIAD